MELEHTEAVARVGEVEPGWAEVVESVICDGRPGFLRDAADRYEHLLRRMHDEATGMEDELGRLAQSWDGAAFAAYHATIETVIADLRETAGKARAVVDALRLAADLLRGHQERIPVPQRLGGDVFRAHQQRRESGGGLAPSNADFEQAVHADIVATEPWLPAAQALEQAKLVFAEQQNVARRVFRELSAAYRDVEAMLPELPVVAAVAASGKPGKAVHGAGRKWSNVDVHFGGGFEEGDDAQDGLVDETQADVIGVAEPEVAEVPVFAALGGHDDGDRRSRGGGNLSGSGAGPLGPGLTDTGAAYGVPVSVMGTPSVSSSMGLSPSLGGTAGMGMPPATPMSTGYGGVIGGAGHDNTHSTWLTAEDEPFEQDGPSEGAVLS